MVKTAAYIDTAQGSVACTGCLHGATEIIQFNNHRLQGITRAPAADNAFFCGPGLIDLQINGVNGIDFNVATLSVHDMIESTQYLLNEGVTTFFPTVITNADDSILTILHTITAACRQQPLVNACVGGIHLEGPFISSQPGAKGAHNEAYIKAPDWDLFCRFQEAAEGRIKIITLAPEWEGAAAFIRKCTAAGVIVSIGHSLADSAQIAAAVDAGACMSTHLGNGLPLMVKRHPNLLWDQLAADRLYTCIIADGIHVPDAFIKVVQKVKEKKALVVSDATCFAGMAPGEYRRHIGGDVILDKEKRVSLKDEPGLLAGAAKTILENVETLLERNLCSLGDAWEMASQRVADFLATHSAGFTAPENDLVVFTVKNRAVMIHTVIKNGNVVFTKS